MASFERECECCGKTFTGTPDPYRPDMCGACSSREESEEQAMWDRRANGDYSDDEH